MNVRKVDDPYSPSSVTPDHVKTGGIANIGGEQTSAMTGC